MDSLDDILEILEGPSKTKKTSTKKLTNTAKKQLWCLPIPPLYL